jgi:hypothetical protein
MKRHTLRRKFFNELQVKEQGKRSSQSSFEEEGAFHTVPYVVFWLKNSYCSRTHIALREKIANKEKEKSVNAQLFQFTCGNV